MNSFKKIFLLVLMIVNGKNSLAQITFQKIIGGTFDDGAYSVVQTKDSGYIVAGFTISLGAGNEDIYLIKLDINGDTLWTKTYGGTGNEQASSVQQTFDGGYIIFGFGIIIKTDENGDTIWTKILNIGGSFIKQTSDSGYIIAGSTSLGAGHSDMCLMKTDSMGNILWANAYGGAEDDFANSVQQTSDGGYIIIGESSSFGISTHDSYIVKTDLNGYLLWTKAYGNCKANSIQQTEEGGFIIAGASGGNAFLLKIDTVGNEVWSKTYGDTGNDFANSIQLTNDSGFIVTGYYNIANVFVSFVYLFKCDSNGDTLWTRTFLAGSNDWGTSVQQTIDSGFVVAGLSKFGGPNSTNMYLIKTNADGKTYCYNGSYPTVVGLGSLVASNAPTITTSVAGTTLPYSLIIGNGGSISNPCSATAIDEDEFFNPIHTSPNPFMTDLSIRGTKQNNLAIIYDITGKEIFRQITSEGDTKINTDNFINGFYILNYIDEKENRNVKVKLVKM